MRLRFDGLGQKSVGVYFQYHDVVVGQTVQEHSHDFYEIFVIIAGEITHLVNGTEQILKKGDMVFIRPDDRHCYRKSNKGKVLNIAYSMQVAQAITLLLGAQRLKRYFEGGNPFVGHIGTDYIEGLKAEVAALSAMEQNGLLWETRIKKCVYDLYCMSLIQPLRDENMPVWLFQLVNHMRQPENFIIGTKRLYGLTEKSSEHVSRLLRKYYHKTPTEFVNDLRLNYIKNRLVFTNDSVTDICFSAGFNNLNYFYGLFKKQNGISPSQYRKRNKVTMI